MFEQALAAALAAMDEVANLMGQDDFVLNPAVADYRRAVRRLAPFVARDRALLAAVPDLALRYDLRAQIELKGGATTPPVIFDITG